MAQIVYLPSAGVGQASMAADTSPEIVDTIIRTNTIGPIILTQIALPHMLKQQKGHFVVVSSLSAKVPAPAQALYSGDELSFTIAPSSCFCYCCSMRTFTGVNGLVNVAVYSCCTLI